MLQHFLGRFPARLVAIVIAFAATVTLAWGQHGSEGRVNVTILDPDGRVVQGAQLELRDLATNDARMATTPAAGTYSFVNLSIGSYKLTVAKSGFKTQVLTPIVVEATKTNDVEARLALGAASETVEVQAQAQAVETTSNAITTTITPEQIENLPLGGRDLTQFARLTPGFTGSGTAGTWNGLPVIAQGNNIDGVIGSPSRMKFGGNAQAAVAPRLENIEELTVQTDQLDVNSGYGQASMQINFITRRGSNAFHGRIYEDFRNSALNANSWRNNALGIKKPPFILNEFGGSVGGPIIHDKLFFFGSFSMSKQPGSITAFNSLLAPGAEAGNFVYTGSDGQSHTVNVLNAAHNANATLPNTVNSVIAAQFTKINNAQQFGTIAGTNDPNVNTLNWLTPSPTTFYYPAVRVDYNYSQRLRMNLAWNQQKQITPANNSPVFPGPDFANTQAGTRVNNYTASYGIDFTISPTLVNQFKAGYLYNVNRFAYNAAPLYATAPTVFWNYPGFTNNQNGPAANSISGQVYQLPITSYYPLFSFSDTMSWQRGAHSFSFGGSWWREQDHYWNPPAGFANYNLGLAAGDPAINALTNSGAGATLPSATTAQVSAAQQLYAILTGRLSSVGGQYKYDPKSAQYVQQIGAYNLNELTKAWGLFFQDSWRFRPNLTINYGLRWDFTGDDHDLGVAYHNAAPDSIFGPTAAGDLFKPGVLNGNQNPQLVARPHVYDAWKVSPQPILGFAWSPQFDQGILGKILGKDSTVIRGGFALRKFTEPYQYFWDAASDFGSFFYQSFSLNPDTSGRVGTYTPGSLALGNALPPFGFSPTSYQPVANESQFTFISNSPGVNGMNNHIGQPYTEAWNLGIQRSLGASRALEIRYQGNRSLHQWINLNVNEVNIFENGFLQEFQNAQQNLAINAANGIANNFKNNGFPGQVNLPIIGAAFTGVSNANGYTNGTFITQLQTGQAGSFAARLSGVNPAPYFCNLVGKNFSPCATNLNFTGNGAGYPINFFQANPFAVQGSSGGAGAGYLTDAGYSNYNSLQVDFRQRTWHGMQFDANYTWSHTLGVSTPNDWTGAYSAFTLRNLRRSYGPTLYDLRHVIHINGTVDLPFGQGKRWANQGGIVDKVIGGWNVGTIVTYQTGFPFQLTSGFRTFNNIGDSGILLNGVTVSQLQDAVGVYRYTPAQNGGRPVSTVDFINPKYLVGPNSTNGIQTAFVTPNITPGVIAGTPYLYGPHGFYDDMAITKNFTVTERIRFNFQSEFLNVFNHPVFGNTTGLGGNVRTSPFTTGVSNANAQGRFGRVIEFRANLTF